MSRTLIQSRALRGPLSFAFVSRALALSALSLVGCGKSAPGGDAASSASPSTSAAAPSVSGSPAASGAAAAKAPGAASPAAGAKGITVAIKDLQLFHPYSSKRTLQPIREDNNFSTRDSSSYFGIGALIEATNDTGEVLRDVSFEGTLRFISGSTELTCKFDADNLADFSYTPFLSYAPKPPGKEIVDPFLGPSSNWKGEGDSTFEASWRPSERVRMAGRTNCETLVLGDLAPSEIKGSVVVKAWRRFTDWHRGRVDDRNYDISLLGDTIRVRDRSSGRISLINVAFAYEVVAAADMPPDGRPIPLSKVTYNSEKAFVAASEADRVESTPVEFTLNPRTLSLQLVKLPAGDFVHASGNVVVYTKDGKITYDDLGKLKVSMLDVERKDVPSATPDVAFTADELSGRVTGIALVPYTEDTAVPKGERRLRVTWKLGIKGGDIEGRLKAAVDAATSALEAAEKRAEAVSIDTSADAAAEAAAKADVAKAKADKTAAESKFKTSLSGERGRLAKLLACGDVRLVTNKTVRSPTNGKAASDACKGLEKSDDVEVTMIYALDRYELPVALSYATGKTSNFSAIASEPLLKLDPR